MLSFNRKSFGVLLSVGTFLLTVVSLITVNAEENSKSSAQNAVVVPQGANLTPAQKFFEKMSPEEFRNPIAMDDFISRFPDSPEARAVFAIRFSLLEQFPSIEGFNDFIQKYPDKLQTQIAIQEVFKLYCNQNRVSGYYDFIQRYPNTEQALVAKLYIQEIMFQYACQLDTVDEYDAFIEAFPDAPQVETARKKSIKKATEVEQEELRSLNIVENIGEIEKRVAKKTQSWIKKFDDYSRIESTANNNTQAKELLLYQLDRSYQVLRDIYSDYASNFNSNSIKDDLDRISTRIKDEKFKNIFEKEMADLKEIVKNNHTELINSLKQMSDNICSTLDGISKEQKDLLEGYFKTIHDDLIKINGSIKDTNKTLASINKNLDDIAKVYQVITRFPTSDPFPRLDVYFEKGEDYTNSFEPDDDINGVPFDFVEYRKQATRSMKDIALCGYETVRQKLFVNNNVGTLINNMKEKWRSFTGSNTTIGKFLGKLVEKAVEFVPFIGPYIAPMAGEVTEYYVDEVFIPYIKEVVAKTKGNIELCKRMIEEYKQRLIKWVEVFANEHPELVVKIKNVVNKFKIVGESVDELVKSFNELAIQVARELEVKVEVLLYDIIYLN